MRSCSCRFSFFLRWNVISSYTPRAETGVWCVLDSRLLLMIRKLQHATQNEREVEENTKRKNRDFFPSFYEFYSSSPEQSVCCFVWASADSLFPYHHHHLTDSFREIVKKKDQLMPSMRWRMWRVRTVEKKNRRQIQYYCKLYTHFFLLTILLFSSFLYICSPLWALVVQWAQ